MGTVARRLEVVITGDASSLKRAYGQGTSSTKKFGSSLLGLSAKTTIIGGAMTGLALAVRTGWKEMAEGQTVGAQTAAALKSTGMAAGVTQGHIQKLAAAMQAKTGIDDESVQAGQNVLLSFTKIRNEAGKGPKVFDRAAQAMADFAVRTGRDMPSAATLLGKALNDPIKGLGALSRVGVRFTDGQKAQIKAMVEAGNVAGAQGLVLAELEKRYGNAAAAAGDTLPGKLQRGQRAFEEFAGSLTEKVAPSLSSALGPALAALPTVLAMAAAAIGGAMNILISTVTMPFKLIAAVIKGDWSAAWKALKAPAEAAINLVKGLVAPLLPFITAAWNSIKRATDTVWSAIRGATTTAWNAVKTAVTTAIGGVVSAITGAVGTALGAATRLGGGIISGVRSGVANLVGFVSGKISDVVSAVAGFVGKAMGAAKDVGVGILRGVSDGLTGLVLMVRDWFQTLWKWIAGAANSAHEFALEIGRQLVHGIWDGISGAAGWLYGKAAGFVSGLKSKLTFWGSGPYDFGQLLGKDLVKGLTKALTDGGKDAAGAAGQLVSGTKSAALEGLNDVGQAIVAAAKKYGVDARAALAVAMGEGGVKFGAVGDSGTSFGPFQLHIGGASPSSDPKKAAEFANSIRGIEYAIRKMAEAGAKGKSGFDAINAIIRNFERPLDPDSSVRNAVARYATIPAAIGAAVTSAGPIVGSAVQAQLAQIAAKVREVAPTIGLAKARGIVAGFLQAAPTLTQQIKQALSQAATEAIQAAAAKVKEAREAFGSAFGELANSALAAFDSQVAKWKSPAAKLLEKMQLEDQLKQLNSAITAGTAGIETAQAGLTAALAGGNPEEIKAAQAAVLAAQETFNQAVRAKEEFNLGQLAAKQEAAHAKAMERKRVQFENQLIQLQNALARHPEEHEKIQTKIKKLLEKFVPGFQASGAAIGYAIAQGLRESTAAVEREAEKLAQAIANKLKLKSPAKEGPLSDLDKWWKGFAPTLLSGLDTGAISKVISGVGGMPAMAGAGGGGGRMPTGGMAMAGGGGPVANVTVNVHGSVIRERDLAVSVRDALVQKGYWTGGGMLGGQG